MHDFGRWMRGHFGTTPPVGHRLREAHPERWLRLHSLPGSKRYAEDDAERAEIRRRAWAAASELFETGKPVWLVARSFEVDVSPTDSESRPASTRVEFPDPADDETIVAFVARTTWPDADFERWIDAIADDGPWRAVWFAEATGEAFAPYDGGFDLVLASAERAEALRRVFPPDWFPSRADGL